MEEEQCGSHHGRNQTQEDVSEVAQIIGFVGV